jgi:hypothetical protein
MSAISLEPSELSYLLQTVNARSVIGIDNAELFPEDSRENEALLKEGSEQLQSHGWLSADAASGKMHFDDQLCYMIAIMADPEYAIMTVRQEAMGPFQLVAHYLVGQLIVEQSRSADGKFRLAFVSRLSTAVERIQSIVQLTRAGDTEARTQIYVDRQAYARVKDLVRTGKIESAIAELTALGIERAPASSLVDAMQMPSYRTAVAVFQRRQGQATTTCNLSVLQGQQADWLMRIEAPDEPHVVLETYRPQMFTNYLAGCVHRTVTGRLN